MFYTRYINMLIWCLLNSRYTEIQFFNCFRFPKNIVLNEIMPMIHVRNTDELIHTDNRGFAYTNIN